MTNIKLCHRHTSWIYAFPPCMYVNLLVVTNCYDRVIESPMLIFDLFLLERMNKLFLTQVEHFQWLMMYKIYFNMWRIFWNTIFIGLILRLKKWVFDAMFFTNNRFASTYSYISSFSITLHNSFLCSGNSHHSSALT